jgi:DNA-binding transcriptional ArsR family regulator
MSGLLPTDADADDARGDPQVLWLDDDDAEELITSLSSETARAIVTTLHREQATASELADRVDTSLQNVRHHLDHLQEAGLVEATSTRYSVKGREMTVYAPADRPTVVCVGREDDREGFLDSLRRLVGVLATLTLVGVLVEALFGAGVATLAAPETAPRVGDAVGTDPVGPILGLLPPGVAFVAGGLLVLTLVVAWERWRSGDGSAPGTALSTPVEGARRREGSTAVDASRATPVGRPDGGNRAVPDDHDVRDSPDVPGDESD